MGMTQTSTATEKLIEPHGPTAIQIETIVREWVAANQTGKRRPGIKRIAKGTTLTRTKVRAALEWIAIHDTWPDARI